MTFRAFIAAEIGAVPTLVDFEKELKGLGCDLKLVEPENIHLTLQFLGDTDEALIPSIRECMEKSVAGSEPFKIRLKGTGVFPKWNYVRVVWVGMEGAEPLSAIATNLHRNMKALGYQPDKPFSAHITLGRMKNQRGRERLQQLLKRYQDTVFGELTVDSIQLKKSVLGSQGPTYSTIEKVHLAAQSPVQN